MTRARRILTNFSKGELSPKLLGRPDLAIFFEGGSTIENWNLLRQGGVSSRPGSRFVAEVKDSAKDTILLNFESSVSLARVIEVGDGYMRFYKPDKTRIESGGVPVEIVSPYTEAQIRDIHYTQSIDVMYLVHPSVQQRKLSRVSDTNWSLQTVTFDPPPSFEKDTDISGGATLTPDAISGTNVIFTASAAVFLEGDVGRLIIFGTSRAVITAFGANAGDTASPNDHVRCTILDNFPNTNPIASGSWLLRLSPQTTLDPDKKEPVGGIVTMVAGTPTFRTADVGKIIIIYGGVVKITERTSATSIKGEIRVAMEGTADANPNAAPAGAWQLEETSWSAVNGFPRTIEFFQDRLAQAATTAQPTAFWLSASDDFENYGIGIKASDAIDYTIAHRQLNNLEWLADNIELFIGSAGAEINIKSGKTGEPLGGDKIPLPDKITTYGSAHIQPIVTGRRIIFIDRSLKHVLHINFAIEEDGFDTTETSVFADHIAGNGFSLGPVGFAKRPDPRLFMQRSDGQIVTLTFFPRENVIGFTRYKTVGSYKANIVIPQTGGLPDQLWAIVERTINGSTKKYVEVFDMGATELTGREWTSVELDCAKVYDLNGIPTTVFAGLSHLEGETVDIVADGSRRASKVVTSGQITLDEAASDYVEIGLPFEATLTTMPPALPEAMMEGVPRQWKDIWVRLLNSYGGKVNDINIDYPAPDLDNIKLFTGDRQIGGDGVINTDGRITIKRDTPYPMTVLAVFGEVVFGDHG